MDVNIADHLKALQSEVERLRRRIEGVEAILRDDHQKLEKLEHDHEHDHELIERMEYGSAAGYYSGRRSVPVGL